MDDTHQESYSRFLTAEEIERAKTMTPGEILIEGLMDIVRIAREGGLSDAEADDVMREFLALRARSRFKIVK